MLIYAPLLAGPQNAFPFTPLMVEPAPTQPLRQRRVFNSGHAQAQVCDMVVHERLVGAFFRIYFSA